MASVTTVPRLVGDIGGTNARFALAAADGTLHHERSYRCADFPGLAQVMQQFLQELDLQAADRPREAALAIAAPLSGDTVQMTNLAWSISAAATRAALGFDRLLLLNDFTALALSIRHLPVDGRTQVGGGKPKPHTPIGLIGPGSGLGVSGLLPTGRQWLPIAGEGGHATLPISNEREAAVVLALRGEFTHVSAERILSGPGLLLLYRTLCELDGVPATLDQTSAVTDHAVAQTEPRCVEAVQMFCEWLGTMASDLVLTLGAHGGCFIGGGIVPRFLPFFSQSGFRRRFESKGRYRAYLEPVPVYVITVGTAALSGCARAFSDPSPRVVAA